MEVVFTRHDLLVDILLNLAGDTVYVLRDIIEENAPKTSPPTKHTYKTIKNFSYADLDIFRIERLWKDEK
jgi:histone-lysine N-methyltransferase ASH1L